MSRAYVLFESSFRLDGSRGGEESPNITHATVDGVATLCGRTGYATREQWDESNAPACRTCAKRLAAMEKAKVTA